MNTNRLFYGDIDEIKTEIKEEIESAYWGEELMTFPIKRKEIKVLPYKRKAILVKFPKENYVELLKLKTFKDILKTYYEIIFDPKNKNYILQEDNVTEKRFIKMYSIKQYNGNLKQNESIKILRKKLLEEK